MRARVFGMITRPNDPPELAEWPGEWTSKPLPLYPMLSVAAVSDGQQGLARELARAGADLVLAPTANMTPFDNVNRIATSARAIIRLVCSQSWVG